MSARLIIGPVIGKVTDTTARILIESDAAATATCEAVETDGPHPGSSATAAVTLVAGKPKAFTLRGLEPGSDYRLDFTGVDNPQPSRVRTLPAVRGGARLNIAAVSCNEAAGGFDSQVWQHLDNSYTRPGRLDLLLHTGDQIYGDSAFEWARYLIDSGTAGGTAATNAAIHERFCEEYRQRWNASAMRAVLANVSNLMIWDDHDIRDDWGSNDTDKDPTSVERRIGTIARRVYRAYQRQLWDSSATVAPQAGELESHMHLFGQETGIVFLDQRGARSFAWNANDPDPYLGTAQWLELRNALAPGGKFDAARILIVVTSVPLLYLPTSSDVYSLLADDIRDHWTYGSHQREQIEMVRELRYWKEQPGKARKVLVVGGDVHIGCTTEVFHNDVPVFRQIISSPVTTKPPTAWEFDALKELLEDERSLTDSYAYQHENFTRTRNAAIIVARVPEPLLDEPVLDASLATPAA